MDVLLRYPRKIGRRKDCSVGLANCHLFYSIAISLTEKRPVSHSVGSEIQAVFQLPNSWLELDAA
jgi:hypothetical protein